MTISVFMCAHNFVRYRVGSYEHMNDEMVKLRKMQLTLKRFRHRIDKFRRRTWNERLEHFDTMMGHASL